MNLPIVASSGPKNAKAGPLFPRFAWSNRFPSAGLVYIDSSQTAAMHLPEILNGLWTRSLNERDVAVGFDVEWKPNRAGQSFRMNSILFRLLISSCIKGCFNPISVMQFASSSVVVVIHLSKWKESCSDDLGNMGRGWESLKLMLELGQIKKVGVTIQGKVSYN